MRAEGEFTVDQVRRLNMLLWEARAVADRERNGKLRAEAIRKLGLACERLRLAQARPISVDRSQNFRDALGGDQHGLLAQIAAGTPPRARSPALRELARLGLVGDLGDLPAVAESALGQRVAKLERSALEDGAPRPRSKMPAPVREGRILDDPEPIEGLSTGSVAVPQRGSET